VSELAVDRFDSGVVPVERRGADGIADRHALSMLRDELRTARAQGDARPPLAVVAACLQELGVGFGDRRIGSTISLEQGRDEWLQRLRSADRSRSLLVAYRVAIDDLRGFLDRKSLTGEVLREETIVAYLDDYRRRMRPAPARFFRWFSRRANVPDPFLDLEAPRKPQQEADWLTAEEFTRLLRAASAPLRRRPGLVERDRFVLVALVATGLRRSELVALNWGDLDLASDQPSLLVRQGKGGKPRRQPLAAPLADELRRRQEAALPAADDPIFCGLEGKRLQPKVLADIIRRASRRAEIEKRVTAHTLRHTAATWLRQRTGDARLVAAYLGHADLSTVSRYSHVATAELHTAAAAISDHGGLNGAFDA
jgi:site-specific recombinase XerD